MSEVREKIVLLINVQDERVKASGVAMAVYREARFAVLSWVDERTLTSSWPARAHSQYLMLSCYDNLNAARSFLARARSSRASQRREGDLLFMFGAGV